MTRTRCPRSLRIGGPSRWLRGRHTGAETAAPSEPWRSVGAWRSRSARARQVASGPQARIATPFPGGGPHCEVECCRHGAAGVMLSLFTAILQACSRGSFTRQGSGHAPDRDAPTNAGEHVKVWWPDAIRSGRPAAFGSATRTALVDLLRRRAWFRGPGPRCSAAVRAGGDGPERRA